MVLWYMRLPRMLLLLVLVVMLVVSVGHVGRQIKFQPEFNLLAELVPSAKEVKAFQVYSEHIGCLVYADTFVCTNLQESTAV